MARDQEAHRSSRRNFCWTLAGVVVALSARAAATPARIGFLIPETRSADGSRIEAVRAGLRDLGYIEGKNIVIEYRLADGDYSRLPQLAAELVNTKVDVIVTFGTKALSAARNATTSIPIVDPVMGDPALSGISTSFARPGGNVTGSTLYGGEVAAKKVEMLRQALPRLNKVAVFVNPANASSQSQVKAMRDAADSLSLQLQVVEVRSPGELDAAFAAAKQGAAGALIVATDTLFRASASQIAERAVAQRLPSIGSNEFAVSGGMIGYGPDPVALYRRGAYFVDRLLKGAHVADLPIERPTKLDLLINLKTAKALGIVIPKEMLLRAAEVIQ